MRNRAIDPTAIAVQESGGDVHRPSRVHSVVFDDPEATVHAAGRLRAAGYHIIDVHSPFPVHGIEAALGWRDTRLPWATLVGGIVGVTCGLALALFVHTVSWPLNIGGKTASAIPAIIPVVFELGVLFAAFATVGTLLVRRRLRPRNARTTGFGQPDLRVNDDRFVILVLEQDASFSMDAFRAITTELDPVDVVEAWKVL